MVAKATIEALEKVVEEVNEENSSRRQLRVDGVEVKPNSGGAKGVKVSNPRTGKHGYFMANKGVSGWRNLTDVIIYGSDGKYIPGGGEIEDKSSVKAALHAIAN